MNISKQVLGVNLFGVLGSSEADEARIWTSPEITSELAVAPGIVTLRRAYWHRHESAFPDLIHRQPVDNWSPDT